MQTGARQDDGDLPYDFESLARDAADMEARSPEEDPAVRNVHGSDRAVRETKVRERYGNYMVLAGELWVPAKEPVLFVDSLARGQYRAIVTPGGGTGHMRFRLDQADWMVEEWGEPLRMPNVAVHRPDLLRARTTEGYLLDSARTLMYEMVRSLADQGKDYFAAYHDLRVEADRFAAAMAADVDGDMDALVAMVRAAAAAPAEDPRKDQRSRGEAPHPNLLRRIERTQAAREPLPEFKP